MLIIYSDDFPEHTSAIDQLANLLQSLGFKVFYDEWDTTYHNHHDRWYDKKLQNSIYILIIHSEGTFKKYEADCKGNKVLDNEHLGKESFTDIYWKAQDVAKCNKEKRIISVHFEYTKSRCVFDTQTPIFSIPKKLDKLLIFLNIPKPMPTSMEYLALKDAVQKADLFVKEKPHWFKERYQIPSVSEQSPTDSGISLCDRNISNTSFEHDHGDTNMDNDIAGHYTSYQPDINMDNDISARPFSKPDLSDVISYISLNIEQEKNNANFPSQHDTSCEPDMNMDNDISAGPFSKPDLSDDISKHIIKYTEGNKQFQFSQST